MADLPATMVTAVTAAREKKTMAVGVGMTTGQGMVPRMGHRAGTAAKTQPALGNPGFDVSLGAGERSEIAAPLVPPPDFKTIADFRKDNGPAIRATCRQFVMLCRRLDLFSGNMGRQRDYRP